MSLLKAISIVLTVLALGLAGCAGSTDGYGSSWPSSSGSGSGDSDNGSGSGGGGGY